MSSVTLYPQQDGILDGWTDLVGADFAYLAVDDGRWGGSNDGDTTYITLGRQIASEFPGGIVSFPIVRMAEGLIPTQIVITALAKKEGVALATLQAGFAWGGTRYIAGGDQVVGSNANYTTETWTYTTNPRTSAAWTVDDWRGMEMVIQHKAGQMGKIRVTDLKAVVTYRGETNSARRVLNPIMTGV